MSASLLSDDAVRLTDRQRREQIDVIRRSAERMNRMIQDLLDVARIEGGHFSISCRCEPGAALAHEACAAFEPIARTKQIAIRCTVQPGIPPVYADRDRVVQLLSNYLNNALKFSPAGGYVELEVRPSAEGGVIYAVSDAGPGIQESDLPQLFNRFWQAKRTAHLGTGLGLAISLGIAQAHKGRVWAESTPGERTTFYFELPRARECG